MPKSGTPLRFTVPGAGPCSAAAGRERPGAGVDQPLKAADTLSWARRRLEPAIVAGIVRAIAQQGRQVALQERLSGSGDMTAVEAVARAREALAGIPKLMDHLQRSGRERALMYRMLVLTGLRKGELPSLTAGQLELHGPVAYAVLNAADQKNRRGPNIPLRADLVGGVRGLA